MSPKSTARADYSTIDAARRDAPNAAPGASTISDAVANSSDAAAAATAASTSDSAHDSSAAATATITTLPRSNLDDGVATGEPAAARFPAAASDTRHKLPPPIDTDVGTVAESFASGKPSTPDRNGGLGHDQGQGQDIADAAGAKRKRGDDADTDLHQLPLPGGLPQHGQGVGHMHPMLSPDRLAASASPGFDHQLTAIMDQASAEVPKGMSRGTTPTPHDFSLEGQRSRPASRGSTFLFEDSLNVGVHGVNDMVGLTTGHGMFLMDGHEGTGGSMGAEAAQGQAPSNTAAGGVDHSDGDTNTNTDAEVETETILTFSFKPLTVRVCSEAPRHMHARARRARAWLPDQLQLRAHKLPREHTAAVTRTRVWIQLATGDTCACMRCARLSVISRQAHLCQLKQEHHTTKHAPTAMAA